MEPTQGNKIKNFLIKCFASGFFISYIPAKITGFNKFTGSGFAGTLLAAGLIYLFPIAFTANKILFAIFLAVLFPISSFIAGSAEEIFQKQDDPRIVIDEILGYWIAVLFVPFAFLPLLIAFVLFRILDTLKPWPIKQMENRFRGGLGIIMDDVVGGAEAGILAMLIAKFFLP